MSSVLIVEDEIVLQDVYKLILTTKGYTVYTASNGVEGIEQIKAHKPDVVLLDMVMPVMGGKEVLQHINTKDYPQTKFVAFTNLSGSDTEEELTALGIEKFVLKASIAP